MIRFPLLLSLILSLASTISPLPANDLYRDPKAPLADRVNDLLGKLTLDEKLTLLHGPDYGSQAIPRLGLPPISMVDGGQGVRGGGDFPGHTLGPATLFGADVMLASTWDPELARQIGAAIGDETRNKGSGSQVLLGPGINIHRSPLGGRNGEYFSEDPYLTSRLTVAYIQGIQSQGVAACVKHYACNNEEQDRQTVSVQVDERALREIYLPGFEAAVKEGKVWSIMASYNCFRGPHVTMCPYLLQDILRGCWGFDGEVISDWGAVHEPGAIRAGTDIDMPGGGPGGTRMAVLKAALSQGVISPADVDRAVKNTLTLMIRTGLLDPAQPLHPEEVNSAAHQKLAYQVAQEGIVLLKNDKNILPLDLKSIHRLALIGPGMEHLQLGAEGSPRVIPPYSIMPREAITQRAGAGVQIDYVPADLGETLTPAPAGLLRLTPDGEPGLRGEYFSNPKLQGQPVVTRTDRTIAFDWTKKSPAPGIGPFNFSVRWTGVLVAPTSGPAILAFTADDGCRVYLDNKLVINQWHPGAGVYSGGVNLERHHAYPIRIEYFQLRGDSLAKFGWQLPDPSLNVKAAEAARKADVAIVCVTTHPEEGEGRDRPDMFLPRFQDDLVQAVAAANPHTIVILNNGGPLDTSRWLQQVPGLVEAYFPGQEGAHALADILFGDINPSGKVSDTLALHREDYPDYGNFPGTDGVVKYQEGIYVGYRHFDKANIAPVFPFGFGLSYTTFKYGNLRLSAPQLDPAGSVDVLADITNTGPRAGDEIAQLYIHDQHPQIDKAVRELKGFARVSLAPGETKTVKMTLVPRDFAYCDVPGKQWRADAGDYEVQVGASSRDLPLQTTLRLSGAFTEPIPGLVAPTP
jgi:beta-glucosidase